MRILFLAIFLFYHFSFAQTSASYVGGLSLLRPIKPHSSVRDLHAVYNGSLKYDGKIFEGTFTLVNDYLLIDEERISLFDKKLTELDFMHDEKSIRIMRIGPQNLLHRVLRDSLGMQLCDLKIFDSKTQADKNSLIFIDPKQTVRYRNSIFRSQSADISTFLSKIHVDESKKRQLELWMRQILSSQ